MSRKTLLFIGIVALRFASASALADLQVYHSDEKPDSDQPPPGAPWTAAEPGGTITIPSIEKGDRFYIGLENVHLAEFSKVVTLTITGEGAHDLRSKAGSHGKGHYTDSDGNRRSTRGVQPKGGRNTETADTLVQMIKYSTQPDWEWIRFKYTGDDRDEPWTLTVTANSECSRTRKIDNFSIESSGAFGALDAEMGPMVITEIIVIPDLSAVNPDLPMYFNGPPESAEWSASLVFEDPDGTPRPQGGVRFTAEGPGLLPESVYTFGFSMLDPADNDYLYFAYDAITGTYQRYHRDIRPQIEEWRSLRSHGPAGVRAIALDSAANGTVLDDHTAQDAERLPTTEPRAGGLELIEVTLNKPVTLVDGALPTFSNGETTLAASSVELGDDGTTIQCLTLPGVLDACWDISFEGVVTDLTGDADCRVIVASGDVDGNGVVNDADVAMIQAREGDVVDESSVRLDLDLDGMVLPNDLDLCIANNGFRASCAVDVPWYEDLEDYLPGAGCHGEGGWRGWDDDPAFDAPATDARSHGGDNSVEIGGDADLVRGLNGADAGAWRFTGWQYIPSNFESGGGGQYDGSYFILLNTYQPGGPYHWSVQMQFDSNDGMLKVYHGDDTATINVPYETDRWVRIQAEIDLDTDWTQVYYDDELVAEYSWTGGVIGDGGGALDIAAVDLFANGSSKLYYDDLRLEPAVIFPPACPEDIDEDNEVGFSDLLAILSAWGACDGCPEDVNGDGEVGFADLLAVLSAWGPCP